MIKREWVVALNERVPRTTFATRRPRLLYMAVDPGGGGSKSSYAICTVALQPDDTTVRPGGARWR
jgi:hypothetical protein